MLIYKLATVIHLCLNRFCPYKKSISFQAQAQKQHLLAQNLSRMEMFNNSDKKSTLFVLICLFLYTLPLCLIAPLPPPPIPSLPFDLIPSSITLEEPFVNCNGLQRILFNIKYTL